MRVLSIETSFRVAVINDMHITNEAQLNEIRVKEKRYNRLDIEMILM